ncbi:MAG: hypothetical protein IJ946_08890 [Clostridia bacterium]|nr:hypothetical protein [Clostridia bacterium]
MKKLFAVVLAIALVLSLSVSAFALKSPGGNVYFEVLVNRTNTGENSEVAEKVTVLENGTIELAPVENDEIVFEGWGFYDKNMNAAKEGVDFEIIGVTFADGTVAVKGEDYVIENGKVVAKNGEYLNVSIKPLADGLQVSELYEGVDVEITPPKDEKPVSPPTGVDYSVVVMLIALALVSGAAAVASAKRVRG